MALGQLVETIEDNYRRSVQDISDQQQLLREMTSETSNLATLIQSSRDQIAATEKQITDITATLIIMEDDFRSTRQHSTRQQDHVDDLLQRNRALEEKYHLKQNEMQKKFRSMEDLLQHHLNSFQSLPKAQALAQAEEERDRLKNLSKILSMKKDNAALGLLRNECGDPRAQTTFQGFCVALAKIATVRRPGRVAASISVPTIAESRQCPVGFFEEGTGQKEEEGTKVALPTEKFTVFPLPPSFRAPLEPLPPLNASIPTPVSGQDRSIEIKQFGFEAHRTGRGTAAVCTRTTAESGQCPVGFYEKFSGQREEEEPKGILQTTKSPAFHPGFRAPFEPLPSMNSSVFIPTPLKGPESNKQFGFGVFGMSSSSSPEHVSTEKKTAEYPGEFGGVFGCSKALSETSDDSSDSDTVLPGFGGLKKADNNRIQFGFKF